MAWARTGSGHATDAVASTLNTGALSVTQNDRVFVCGGADSSGTWNTPTDTQLNTYTLIQTGTNSSGAKYQLYTAVFSATGTNTITQTKVASGQDGLSWMTFSGLSLATASGCVDVSITNTGWTGLTATSFGTTATTTGDNQLIITNFDNWGSVSGIATPSAGYTKDTNASFAGTNADHAWAYKNSAISTAETGTWAEDAATTQNVAGAVVIKLFTASPPIIPRRDEDNSIRRAAKLRRAYFGPGRGVGG
jgi:hypothetical protein